MSLDNETIELLKQSKEKVGYLNPVVQDQHGNILSGRHRKYADANWPTVTREVKDDLERELLIIHYNVQRSVPREETQNRLLRIAKILEHQGVEPEEICARVTELTGFSREYVRQLLPDEYKMLSHRPTEGASRDDRQPVDDSHQTEESWDLEYFGVPLIPERYRRVEDALDVARKKWDLHDDGEALWRICEYFLETVK